MIKFFDIGSIDKAKTGFFTAPSGFKYGFIADIFQGEIYKDLCASFPDVKKFKLVDKMSGGGHKRFFIGQGYDLSKTPGCVCHMRNLPEIWREVLLESLSVEFIKILSDAMEIRFNTGTVFGFTYGNEGCQQEAHIDGEIHGKDNFRNIKGTVATLLYFNENPNNTTGTAVYGPDHKTILFQAPSMRNGMLFFEQHPEAWHGFSKIPARHERRLVSLAYGQNDSPVLVDDSFAHRIKCKYRYISLARKVLGRNRSDKSY